MENIFHLVFNRKREKSRWSQGDSVSSPFAFAIPRGFDSKTVKITNKIKR